jgi:hypothetical protein
MDLELVRVCNFAKKFLVGVEKLFRCEEVGMSEMPIWFKRKLEFFQDFGGCSGEIRELDFLIIHVH